LSNEELSIEACSDAGLQQIFKSNTNLTTFWIKVLEEYLSNLAVEALTKLNPFSNNWIFLNDNNKKYCQQTDWRFHHL